MPHPQAPDVVRNAPGDLIKHLNPVMTEGVTRGTLTVDGITAELNRMRGGDVGPVTRGVEAGYRLAALTCVLLNISDRDGLVQHLRDQGAEIPAPQGEASASQS